MKQTSADAMIANLEAKLVIDSQPKEAQRTSMGEKQKEFSGDTPGIGCKA